MLIMARNPVPWAGVPPATGGGGGGPYPVPPVNTSNEFYHSTRWELSGGIPVDARVSATDDFSREFAYQANGEGWRLGTSAPPTRVFTGGPFDSANLIYTAGIGGSIYSDLIPADSSEWTPLGMDGILVKNIGTAGRGTAWAMTNGVLAGGGDDYSNYIWQRRLSDGAGTATTGLNAFAFSIDVYIPSDYLFGAQKMLTPLAVGYDSGIIFGNLHMNLGAGGTSTTGTLAWQGAGTNVTANSLATITRGRWWNFQFRITLNVGSTGSLHIYATDLGTDGLSVRSGGTPTEVYANTSYTWTPLDGTSTAVSMFWFDWWANPLSTASAPGVLATNFDAFNVDEVIPIREAP